eukprot:6666784-Pyramimonas_sp.AAC.1
MVPALKTSGGKYHDGCPRSRGWRRVEIWFQELAHLRASASEWGKASTMGILGQMRRGPHQL